MAKNIENELVNVYIEYEDNNNIQKISFEELNKANSNIFKDTNKLQYVTEKQNKRFITPIYENREEKNIFKTLNNINQNDIEHYDMNLDNISAREYVNHHFDLQKQELLIGNINLSRQFDLQLDAGIDSSDIQEKIKTNEKNISKIDDFIQTNIPNTIPDIDSSISVFIEENKNEFKQNLTHLEKKSINLKEESTMNNAFDSESNIQPNIDENKNVSFKIECIDKNGNEFTIPFKDLSDMKATGFKDIDSLYIISETEQNRNVYPVYETETEKEQHETVKTFDENMQDIYFKMGLDHVSARDYINKYFDDQAYKLDRDHSNLSYEKMKIEKDESISEFSKMENIKKIDNDLTKINITQSRIKELKSLDNPNFDPFEVVSKEENKNEKIQKLKSIELEKNIIGLLPKEEQQNNFKETLSRLEKNKSDLVSHLKEQLGINKVNDIIKSVKDNFENIKIKAEDIHQTFKDLGNWNTNNNFVKNIDNVVFSIKELGKKHENELLQSDSKSIMNKLSKEYNELKNFVNKAENEDKIYNQKNEVRNNFIKDTLKLNGVNTEVNSQELLENLSDNQKTGLYNYLKDTNSHYKNLSTDSSMEKEYQNNVLIKEIEKQMPEVIKYREEYLATNPKIQTLNFDNSNDKIKEFIDNRNNDIKNMSKNDRTNSAVNQKQELNISKQNNKSNQIKNNDMFKKMNRIEAENLEQTQNETKKKSNSIVR